MSEQEYFEENGYVVVPSLFNTSKIDRVLEVFDETIQPSRLSFYRQSSARWEKNKLNSSGYVTQSFLDPHDLEPFPDWSNSIRQLFNASDLLSCLTRLTGQSEFNIVQTMFFDANTATPAHRDDYYLDSIPNGNLFAVWIAAEDIHQEAGRFYVVPRSHRMGLELTKSEMLSNALYQNKIQKLIDSGNLTIVAPELKKGDALFWRSDLIHGALPTTNASLSRKSLTAHFLPKKFQFGSRYRTDVRKIDYFDVQGFSFARVPSDRRSFSVKSLMVSEAMKLLDHLPLIKSALMSIKGQQVGRTF